MNPVDWSSSTDVEAPASPPFIGDFAWEFGFSDEEFVRRQEEYARAMERMNISDEEIARRQEELAHALAMMALAADTPIN